MKNNTKKAWAFKTIDKEKLIYRGNNGYDDAPEMTYSYDNMVANHKQVAVGDIVIIYNREKIIGAAEITELKIEDAFKTINLCPIKNCEPEKLKTRENKKPIWRCSNGHEFNVPSTKIIPIKKFTALYSKTFQRVDKPYIALESKILNHNKQLSIQEVKLDWAISILENQTNFIDNLSGSECSETPALFEKEDLREIVNRSIKQRRGQRTFRDSLLKKNQQCAVTKCVLIDLLEAAHIYPFRNKSHNHISNGILLRADIHTLFDLDLIAIHPTEYTVNLNKALIDSEYQAFNRVKVSIAHELSQNALESRWLLFNKKNK